MKSESPKNRVFYIAGAVAIIAIVLAAVLATSGAFGEMNHSNGPSSASTSASTSIVSTAIPKGTESDATTSVAYANGWVTYHGDNARDGNDTSLPNVTSLSVSWKTAVDSPVYAEPLSLNGSVFVATENDTVYSLSATSGSVQWSQHLGPPADSLAAPYDCGANHPDIEPTIGITGTPVIDPASQTLYVAALLNGTGYGLYAIN